LIAAQKFEATYGFVVEFAWLKSLKMIFFPSWLETIFENQVNRMPENRYFPKSKIIKILSAL
jgi:hypothetical protein